MTRFDWEGAKPVLLDLLAAGKSAQQIAAEIGTTRHAVIGFIHRNPELKELWAGRSEREMKPKPMPKPVAVDPEAMPAAMQPEPTTLTDLGSVRGERRASILDVRAGQCRWPVADDPTVTGGIVFCGAPTAEIYCRAHRRLAFRGQHPAKRASSAPPENIRIAATRR